MLPPLDGAEDGRGPLPSSGNSTGTTDTDGPPTAFGTGASTASGAVFGCRSRCSDSGGNTDAGGLAAPLSLLLCEPPATRPSPTAWLNVEKDPAVADRAAAPSAVRGAAWRRTGDSRASTGRPGRYSCAALCCRDCRNGRDVARRPWETSMDSWTCTPSRNGHTHHKKYTL